jgi:four helix bundle protein
MRSFRTFKVWEKAHQLALDIYQTTAGFPREETYGLSAQMRRSSSSIPTNIAEGCGRQGRNELARFLQIAMGSASELQYQLLLARDLNMLEALTYSRHSSDLDEIQRMLGAYLRKVRGELMSNV